MHELGLAFDLWVNDESQLSDLGQVWEGMGGVWGGHFHDPIHFEAGGDLSDYAVGAALDTEQAPPPPDVPLGERLTNLAGSFVPVLGQYSQLAQGLETTFPSLSRSGFIKQSASPYHIIMDPLKQLWDWIF